VPKDSAFTASCERFYSNCDREMRLAVADLDSVRLRDVLQRNKVEISAGTFRPAIGDWDVSRVTDMSGLFADWADFNQPIGNWDTSRVTDMSRMFANATAFNQPLTWDVRSVVSLYAMFRNATSFNSPIVLRRTGGVVNMSSMFEGAEQFDQPLALDTGNVKSIARMFAGARSFARAAELSDLRVCRFFRNSLTGIFEGAHLDARIRTRTIIDGHDGRILYNEGAPEADGCAIS
jgi:surface protein